MPTETDRANAVQRRAALGALASWAGLSAWALLPSTATAAQTAQGGQQTRSAQGTPTPSARPSQQGQRTHTAATATLVAAWEQRGSYHIGLISVPSHGLATVGENTDAVNARGAEAGGALRVHATLEVPSRPHGVYPLPDGSVLAVARRPGDWMVRWHPGSSAEPLWLWQSSDATFPDRTFNGHVLASPDATRIYTTETDVETGASLIGVRDALTLEKQAEWPTHGIDAHELIWDHRHASPATGADSDSDQATMPTLIVANGGVPTAPETGRAKRDMHRMDSSLVRLDGRTGALLGQWRLQDQRLSLRHLAWNRQGTVLGIALQAEHDDLQQRHAAPVHARFDGQALHTQPVTPAQATSQTTGPTTAIHTAASARLQGYGGSIVATPQGWAVSCPKAGCAVLVNEEGERVGQLPLAEVCALASDGQQLWAGGVDESQWHGWEERQAAQEPRTLALPHPDTLRGARLDNHWGWMAGT